MERRQGPPLRAILYIKDIMNITGRKLTAARGIYHSIRAAFKKEPWQQGVTVKEYCQFMGMTREEVERYLR